MPRFVVDEDMPRSTGRVLREEGHEVRDIRDHGLRGAKDEQVYQFAQGQEAVLLTGDRGFGNILRFPLGSHFGIVVARFPNETPPQEMNRHLLLSLKSLEEGDFRGNLIVIEPGRMRIRRG